MSKSIDSETKLCNLALAKIGEPKITALTESSKAARLCASFYEQVRDELLEEHYWNFATRRVHLSLDGTTPDSQFSYRHTLPDDHLALRLFNRETREELEEDYQIEGNYILSDAETVYIIYTARVTTVADFPPLFIKALSSLLAAELAMPLVQSAKFKEEQARDAMVQISKAKKKDANQNRHRFRGLEHMLANSAVVKERRVSALG